MIGIGIYKLSLRARAGNPATQYELTTVPDAAFGTDFSKAAAYCSDGSGEVFFAADGKAEPCLRARKTFH